MKHGLGHFSSTVLWIVVEDGLIPNPAVEHILEEFPAVPHLYFATPSSPNREHRGVDQRNAALTLIKERGYEGIVYFADDDNAYAPTLFHLLQEIREDSFAIFPVGNLGYWGFEGPIFGNGDMDADDGEDNTKISYWCCDYCLRKWNVDMAGFAFHSSLLKLLPSLQFNPESALGHLESDLITILVEVNATLQAIPGLIKFVHVWHDPQTPFKGAAYYMPDWHTSWIKEHLPKNGEMEVRGFMRAAEDLPRAEIVSS